MSSTIYSFIGLPFLTKHILAKKIIPEISPAISCPGYLENQTISFKNKVRESNDQTLTLSQMEHTQVAANLTGLCMAAPAAFLPRRLGSWPLAPQLICMFPSIFSHSPGPNLRHPSHLRASDTGSPLNNKCTFINPKTSQGTDSGVPYP